jgi:Transposase domain (DUF772).
MLKLRDGQITMWDAILPEPVRTLPAELAIIDRLLDDERFLQPFAKLHPKGKKSGRPTFAIEKYIRLMVLKHKYNLGYESLVKEVGDSITWRLFCRIAIDEPMPDPSTLIYARKRYGDKIVEDINAALVKQCEEKAILKTRKFRTDTTVVESDIHHPTDASLLQDGVKVITRMIQKNPKRSLLTPFKGLKIARLKLKKDSVHRQSSAPSHAGIVGRSRQDYAKRNRSNRQRREPSTNRY